MATRKAAARRSAKQVAASRAWAAAGRKSQAASRAKAAASGKKAARSSAQVAASRAWAAAGRAAQAARRAGKQPVKPKPVAAAMLTGATTGSIHELPVCAAVAVAEHLRMATGYGWSEEDVLALAVAAGTAAGGTTLEAVLETAASGFRGAPSLRYWPAEPGPFTVAGLVLPDGRPHAALVLPGNLVSWDSLIPQEGPAGESWAIWWED